MKTYFLFIGGIDEIYEESLCVRLICILPESDKDEEYMAEFYKSDIKNLKEDEKLGQYFFWLVDEKDSIFYFIR